MFNEPYVLWFILGVALSIMEIFTAGFFIIWFGVAAFITAIAAYFYHNFIFELIVYTVAVLSLLSLTKPFVKKLNETPSVASNVDALIGKIATVVVEINNVEGKGLVKVDGETWSARSTTGNTITVGTSVVIERVDGAKLLVKEKK